MHDHRRQTLLPLVSFLPVVLGAVALGPLVALLRQLAVPLPPPPVRGCSCVFVCVCACARVRVRHACGIQMESSAFFISRTLQESSGSRLSRESDSTDMHARATNDRTNVRWLRVPPLALPAGFAPLTIGPLRAHARQHRHHHYHHHHHHHHHHRHKE